MENKKKAILAVSFGTSFHETREKTIDRIEADLAAAYRSTPCIGHGPAR